LVRTVEPLDRRGRPKESDMDLTNRLTRILLGAMTLGVVLVPATVAGAEPPGGDGELTTVTTEPDPCFPGPCEPPEPECPPFVATCDDVTSDPCNPIEEDCSPGPECPQDADCPEPECPQDAVCPDPNPEPEPEVDPDPEPVDPSVPADPNFTG
jgi:hypothetical protein